MTKRQTTTPLPQLIYPRIVHLRRRIQCLIYTPILDAHVEVRIGPIHHSFITWKEALQEYLDGGGGGYERLAVGERFSPASLPVVDDTSPSSSAAEDGCDKDDNDDVREFPWTQRWFRVEMTLPSSPAASPVGAALQEDEDEDGGIGQRISCCCDQYLYFLAHGEFTVYTNNGDVWCGIDPVHDRVPISPLLLQQQQHQQQDDSKNDDPTVSSSCTIWLDGGECIFLMYRLADSMTQQTALFLVCQHLHANNNLIYIP